MRSINKNGLKNKTYIQYISVAKSYLIILVVLAHILNLINPFYSRSFYTVQQVFISTFHMPAFFIIHGVLFNDEKYRDVSWTEFIKKRVYSLIVPYIFFEIIGMICRTIFFDQPLLEGLKNIILVKCNVGADWFLVAMFIGNIMYMLDLKINNRFFTGTTLFISFIIPIFIPRMQLAVIIGRGLLAYGFIKIGNILKELFLKEKNLMLLIWPFLFVTLSAILNMKLGGNDFYFCRVNNLITLLLGGVCGTIFILQFAQYFNFKVFAEIGKYTLVIMGTHQLVIYIVSAMAPQLSNGNAIVVAIIMAVIIFFEIPVVYILEKYVPFFIGDSKRHN